MFLMLLACTQSDPTATVPRYRYSHVGAFNEAGTHLYISGGSGSGGKRRDAWRIPLGVDGQGTGEWEELSAPPRDVFRSTLVREPGTDIAWVFGGSEGSESTESASLERWDMAGDSWTRMGEGGPSGRYKGDAVWDGSRMLVFGGRFDDDEDTETLGDLWAFDTDSETWSELSPTGSPGALTRTSMALGSDGLVYLSGGIDAEDERYDWVWTLDPTTLEWNEVAVTGTTPGHRASHSSHWYDGQLWVWAGSGQDNALWALDPVAGTWSTSESAGPLGRDAQVTSSPDGRHLFIMGGDPADDDAAPNFVNDVWEVDLDTQIWTERVAWGE